MKSSRCFKEKIPCERIVLRLSRNIQQQRLVSLAAKNKRCRGRREGQKLLYVLGRRNFRTRCDGRLGARVIFSENGIRFEADVVRGQKTGFFLDQRENRREVETLARGRRVLNAFSFSGGFSVYAARGGAKSVTDLDISAHALESAQTKFCAEPKLSRRGGVPPRNRAGGRV